MIVVFPLKSDIGVEDTEGLSALAGPSRLNSRAMLIADGFHEELDIGDACCCVGSASIVVRHLVCV